MKISFAFKTRDVNMETAMIDVTGSNKIRHLHSHTDSLSKFLGVFEAQARQGPRTQSNERNDLPL